jgi:hypothetical protein
MKLVQTVGDRRIATALAAALALALCAVGVVQAGTTRSADFCSASKDVAQTLANLQQQLTSASASTVLKDKFSAITAAEPGLKSTAPRKLKKPLAKVIALANLAGRYLQQANWSIAGLLPHAAALNAQANRTEPSIATLDKYWRGTCHFKI